MEYQFADFNGSDSEEDIDEQQHRHYRPKISIDYCNLTAQEFQQRFRLTPRQIEILIQNIGARLEPTTLANNPLSVKQKILITLRFLASNDFYYSISDSQGRRSTNCFTYFTALKAHLGRQ